MNHRHRIALKIDHRWGLTGGNRLLFSQGIFTSVIFSSFLLMWGFAHQKGAGRECWSLLEVPHHILPAFIWSCWESRFWNTKFLSRVISQFLVLHECCGFVHKGGGGGLAAGDIAHHWHHITQGLLLPFLIIFHFFSKLKNGREKIGTTLQQLYFCLFCLHTIGLCQHNNIPNWGENFLSISMTFVHSTNIPI